MDNITHTLTGVAIAYAGLNRKTRFATLALVIGSNLPDIDILWSFGGSATYLKYHRGITHSILGATILAALLAAVIYYVGNRKKSPMKTGPPLNARWLFLVCWVALEVHVLMDFTNAYGIRLFLPFSHRWYAWDIMYIFDPLLLLVLIACLAVPGLFRLISEEVGAGKPGFRRGAIFALSFLVLLWGLRSFAHSRVMNMLDSHTYGQENPIAIGAFPSLSNPFQWTGVVETQTAFHIVPADTLSDDVKPTGNRIFFKPESSPALVAAEHSRTGAIFLDFARFPWANVDDSGEDYKVTIRDLRFYSPRERRPGFVAEIILDRNLNVLSQTFGFAGGSRVSGD
jgi:inner membrane protein